MKSRFALLLPVLFCLPVMPAFAQTAIGGGTCTSSVLSGTYELLLTGHQTSANGAASKAFQGVGTAAFDGLSKVTFTLTANTVTTSQSFGTPLVYSGTYSLQSNCVGTISITTGDTATFNVEALSVSSSTGLASSFALTGSDATYAYSGSGNSQPATCPTTLSGVHEFSGTGSTLSGASVTGILDLAGVLNFDGQGNLTANWTQVANLTASAVSATGTYSLSSTCLASATLTDTANNKYAVSMSIYTTSPDFSLAISSPQLIVDGSGSATQAATATGCSASTLNGTYESTLSGHLLVNGVTTRLMAANGSVTFDGIGIVTFDLTSNAVNGSQLFGTPLVYSGTYTVQSNCQGTINISGGDTATFGLVGYSLDATTGRAKSVSLVGTDALYAYTGSASVQPALCAESIVSGQWPFSATGNLLSGSTDTGTADIVGWFVLDGQGNVTANWTQSTNTAVTSVSATGTYTVNPACLGSMTLTDTAGNKYSGTLAVTGASAGNFSWVAASPQVVFSATGHAVFGNPGLAVVNAASYTAGQTPAGNVFSIFGTGLATKEWEDTAVPLSTTALTTTVTVNGELAPLFYAAPTQINAQMPEDIKPGVATVIVKNGSATSNAVAVTIPATGTPGISMWGNDRAVVVNQDGTLNVPTTSPAKVGDTVVVYFTGGGPVTAAGPLATGSPSPAGLSWITGTYSVTVGGVAATVNYIGLTPGSIGLYQANFVVPKVDAGDRELVITIAGQASNDPLIAVVTK
jgi:uncharacterized protein (TIGR03437 family)